MPLWLLSYQHGGKTWQLAVNACTGEVKGTYPKDAFRVAMAVILGLVVAGLIAWFISQNQ